MRRIATFLLAVILCIVAVTVPHVRVSNAGRPKNFPPTPTLLPAEQPHGAPLSSDGAYYVSPGGSDSAGNGSLESPWRTVSYALDHGPSNGGFSVVLLDGEYPDQVTTDRSFAEPVQVRALHDYQAVLVNTGSTPIKLGGSSDAHKSFNITFSGLEVKGLGSGSQGYALVYLWKADDVVLENCIIHDSYNNDLMRVLHSARIKIRNCVFYNPDDSAEVIDINGGSQDVVVADSIFFNDYAASGRPASSSMLFVLIKTSQPDDDGITRRITVERNIFLARDCETRWESQLHIGGDSKTYYTAEDITVQNNLFVASDGQNAGLPIRISGARNVLIRANTMRSGPGSFQAMGDIERPTSGPICTNIQYANNVFLDGDPDRFIRGDSEDVENSSLDNNLYWRTPPITLSDYFNYMVDRHAMLADPQLPPDGDSISMPVWLGRVFAGGYGSIPGVFAANVQRYAVPAAGSPVVDAASGDMPPDDITGSSRYGAPDVGAYEAPDSSPVPTPEPTDTPVPPMSTPIDTPVPPTAMPTDTPVLPTAMPTDTPVPPTATPTDTPVPPTATPTDTLVPPTATPTDTPVPPTATPTDTPVPPTATPTDTPVPPTATPTDTPVPPTATATLALMSVPMSPADEVYYVAPGGSDASGNGSTENPWQTVAHALDQGPSSGGFTVILLDGEYPDQVTTDRGFAEPVQVRAQHDYQAVLLNTRKTPIRLTGSKRAHRLFNLTFSGLQIKGRDPRPQGDSLVYLWKADAVTFDNCVIHDSYRNDLVRVLHSAGITIKDSLFYNPDPGQEALEINGGSQDVVVEGSIFFNDYAASGRSASSSRPFVLLTTSGPDDDGITRRITVERNIFLQKVTDAAWSGQIHIGDDSKKDYMAQEITVQNNLFVAADGQNIGVPICVSAARDILIRANTVRSGPGSFQAMGDIQRAKSGPVCTNIQIANNVFLDSEPNRFIRGDSGVVENSRLENNVYWQAPPVTEGDYFNYADDGLRIEADPLLPTAGDPIPMLVLQGRGFAGGHLSIADAFAAYVQRYAVPAGGSPIMNAASGDMPPDDIIGAPRDGAPDVGAYEVDGGSNAPTPTSALPTNTPVSPPLSTPVPPTPKPTNTPVLPTVTPVPPPPTDTPVLPTVMPTDTPLPPAPTDTSMPPAPTDTPAPPTPTDTAILPTPTDTIGPPTVTNTPLPPTATNTPLPPTATNTPLPPTATNTPLPPTATDIPLRPTPTNTQPPVVSGLNFVTTFESIGIYWSPADGSSSNQCQVEYRIPGSSWRQGYPLWYDGRTLSVADEPHSREYRGSLVNLQPGTTYEIRLTLDSGTSAVGYATTWSEGFPMGETHYVGSQNTTLTISGSGTADGYLVYDGQGATIDVNNGADYNIVVNGSYVIVRNFKLLDARKGGVRLNQGSHDVVIENNEITNWGSGSNYECAVDGYYGYYAEAFNLKRIVVQRNKIYNPRYGANNWDSGHPEGPQGVCFSNSGGNHVIRYNTIYSDNGNYYNDILGGGANGAMEGFPSSDSDIYGNILQNNWDDGIESEGGNMNVRIWGNYLSYTFVKVAISDTQVGPLYVFRNVTGVTQRNPSWTDSGARFIKCGGGDGRIYFFHNTLLRTMVDGVDRGIREGISGSISNFVSRNNLLDSNRNCVNVAGCNVSPGSDYDICRNNDVDCAGSHTLINTIPVYSIYDPYDHDSILATGQGDFSLRSDSPGYDYAGILPGFNDDYIGAAPDVGAHEAGRPAMEFGVNAYD
jgi:hypothetical protein